MPDNLFEHDCNNCEFLGTFQEHDLYYCPQTPNWPTVIARYGNNGYEYKSGMHMANHDPHLHEARKRTAKKGLL